MVLKQIIINKYVKGESMNMMSEKSKDFVRKIGSSIHSMSFIIGAGFSKNVSDKYLSWPELLDDMINEMYSNEMSVFDLDKWGIINKYGYLGIASEYIRRKGYHEAIDVYIEQRTPILMEKEDGAYDLILGKEREENVDVSLHRRLLDMKVKNIYTFNYDNALEVYSDLTSTSERRKELEEINEEKKQIDEALYKIRRQYSEVQKEEKVDDCSIEVYTTSEDNKCQLNEIKNLSIVKRICGLFDIKDEDIDDWEFFKEVTLKLEIYRQQLWDSVKVWNKNKAEAYYVVKKSGDITISAGRNIFKLHGSLRELNERDKKYGFDYDNHTQYIIAQEDYDTYNKKHEAFVDLMRISLLKDSYCIIGFSCDDPNFLLWINWVKDIVDKEKMDGGNKENACNKYFINVDDTSLDSAKSLLLSNHYINVVDLYKIYPSAKSKKERLSAFFDDIEKMQSANATDHEFWEHFNFSQSHSPEEAITVEYDTNKIDRAWNLTKNDELSFFASPSDYYRFFFLEKVRGVIIDKKMDDYICKAFAIAANQDNLPLNVIFEDEQKLNYIMDVVYSANDAELKQFYDVMTEQWMLLENKWESDKSITTDRNVLYQCVTCLFNFDFDSCYKIANEWKPVGEYYKVIQLMLVTEQKRRLESADVVFAYAERKLYNTDQEYLIALEQLLGFQPFLWVNHEAGAKFEGLFSKIDELTKDNRALLRLHEYFSKLKKALHKEEKVMPLGREGRAITFGSSDTVTLGAIRILQVIVKLGFVTDRMLSRWLTDKDFFDVIEKTYTLYPYPCLYYASLSTDKNMSKRVAQLYCNSSSDIIQKTLPDILVKILKACGSLNLSKECKNTLYIYASSFIKRVHPKIWMKEFKKLYKTQGLDRQSEREIYTAKYDFAQQAISYSKDNAFKQEIIVGMLNRWENLTHYDNSLLIAATRNIKVLDKTVLRQVYQAMNHAETEPQVFVLFNLQKFIPKRIFYSCVENLDNNLLRNPSIISAVSHVAKKCKRLQKLALQLLADSQYLWNTGIHDDDSFYVTDSITLDIDEFEKNVPICGEAENVAFEVFKKLKEELTLLDKTTEKKFFRDWFHDWSPLIHSMKLFVIRHKAFIAEKDDVHELIEHCDKLYFKVSGQIGFQDKLVHSESYKVEEGISELIDEVRTYGIQHFKMEYDILADLIMQHQTKALDLCMRHFTWAVTFSKYRKFFVSNDFPQKVSLILRVYKPYFMGEDIEEWDLAVNKDVVEKCMLDMNDWLKNVKMADSDWADYEPIYFQIKD